MNDIQTYFCLEYLHLFALISSHPCIKEEEETEGRIRHVQYIKTNCFDRLLLLVL